MSAGLESQGPGGNATPVVTFSSLEYRNPSVDQYYLWGSRSGCYVDHKYYNTFGAGHFAETFIGQINGASAGSYRACNGAPPPVGKVNW